MAILKHFYQQPDMQIHVSENMSNKSKQDYNIAYENMWSFVFPQECDTLICLLRDVLTYTTTVSYNLLITLKWKMKKYHTFINIFLLPFHILWDLFLTPLKYIEAMPLAVVCCHSDTKVLQTPDLPSEKTHM